MCASSRVEGGGELRICKAALPLSVQQLFLPLQLVFLPVFARSRVTLFWFGWRGGEKVTLSF